MQLEWSIREHWIAHVASFSSRDWSMKPVDHIQGSLISLCPPTVTFTLAGMRLMQHSLSHPLWNSKRSATLVNRCALSVDRFNASLIKSCAFACRMVQNILNKGQHYPSPYLHRNSHKHQTMRHVTLWMKDMLDDPTTHTQSHPHCRNILCPSIFPRTSWHKICNNLPFAT